MLPAAAAAGAAAGAAAVAANPLHVPPCLPLVAGESLLHGPHLVEYADLAGLAWLTSMRVMVRADRPNAALEQRIAAAPPTDHARMRVQQFQLPLSTVTGHNVSAASSAKLMLKIAYQHPPNPPSSVIMRFTSSTALEDRTRWKEVLTEVQARNAVASTTVAAAAAATPPAVRVKLEPGQAAPAPVATASHPAAPAPAAAPRIPPAAAPAPLRPLGAGHKRPHSALSGASPAATSLASAAELQSQIRCRAALLARDPALQAVHADLVPNAVTEDEFWAGRTELLRAEQGRQGTGGGSATGSGVQRAGISSAMASTIRPETGCNVVRYTLDATQIHAIFLENPMVYELYQQLVPDKLDEKAFWTRYFKSQYIHSQATTSVSTELNKNPTEDDLFAKATAMQEAKENEHLGAAVAALNNDPAAAATAAAEAEQKRDIATKTTLLQRRVDPSVDLTSADMSNSVMQADPTKSSGSSAAPSSNTTRSKKARAQTELLQRFNRHGMLVLDSNLSTGARNVADTAPSSEAKLQASYHSSLATSLDLTDLATEVAPTYNQLPIGRGFFASLGARKSATAANAADSHERAAEASHAFLRELGAFPTIAAPSCGRHSVQHIPASAESRAILLDLTQTARGLNKAAIAAKQLRDEDGNGQQQQLIVFSTGEGGDMLIPDNFRDQLKKRYHTCNELFRHFWSSLNPRSGTKLQRVHLALDEQYRLLQVIRTSLNEKGFSALVPLLNPLIASIEMCATTYQKWQEKEAKRVAPQPRRVSNGTPLPIVANAPLAAAPQPQPPMEQESKRVKV